MSGPWRALERASQLALSIAGWCFLAMTLLICFDIVARRLLGFSSGATSELSGYLLAIGMSWGLAAALIERAHVRIDILVQKLPLAARAWLHFIALAVLLGVAGFFAWGAAALALDSWQLRATDVSQLSTPLVVPQALWAAGMALFLLAGLGLAARTLRALAAGRPAEVERLLVPRHYEEEVAETLEATRTVR
ncbi:MAG TPA: TRAP transporter small permease [Burkholderiales bacterium]|nr:TRAP transporter small permease [Burkholderiales bacterium]